MTGPVDIRGRAATAVEGMAAAVDRRRGRRRAVPPLPTVPTLPTLPTLGDDGKPVRDDATPAAGTPHEFGVGFTELLYREARLLDERRWDEWMGLWTPDASYAMPTRRTIQPTGSERSVEDELTPADGTWWQDDSLTTLELRVAKLHSGKAWSEEPPSRTRRFVTNVEWEARDGAGGTVVRSNLLLHRGRRDSDVEWFSCARTDLVHERDGVLRIARRRVVIDANVIPADNLVLFL